MARVKTNTSKGPDKDSTRSKRRAVRGFKSVELSTRKGRRVNRRLAISCSINGQVHEPGAKIVNKNNAKNTMTAGGSRQYF